MPAREDDLDDLQCEDDREDSYSWDTLPQPVQADPPQVESDQEHASREEQHGRYLDCGPQAWDDCGPSPDC